MSEATITLTRESINEFFTYQERIYGALGPADEDVIDACSEGLDHLDSFFEQLALAVAEPLVLCDMCGSTTRTRCGRLGCV